jgi:excinuclease ABC subunit C
MNPEHKNKLKTLPKDPGVYFHKDKNGQIIYVGKAANLRNRVRQYFQNSRTRDPKTEALVAEVYDTDWTIVADEVEALFLEAEMIRRYQPKYNILLRDDKSLSYVRINIKDIAPSVTITRRPLDDSAEYIGPFLQAIALKRSLKYLRKIFPYSTHTTLPNRACLQYHLGLCPGPETADYDEISYKQNLKKLMLYLHGYRVKLVNQLEKEMLNYSNNQQYEQAIKSRNSLLALQKLRSRIIFSDKENLDLSKDHALFDLAELFSLLKPPRRIEGYDISHMSGTDTVASMVVFTNGIADKGEYRKFKMRLPGNNDFAHMNEALNRRLSHNGEKKWPKPDLILIDGGKGQLSSAIKARDALDIKIPMIGLAKQYEEIIINKASLVEINQDYLVKLRGRLITSNDFTTIQLPDSAHLVKLLQRVRDESHRFAVSYHSTLKRNRQTTSTLDDIPTIGPITKKILLRHFGSLKAISQARYQEIEKLVGPKKATILKQYLRKPNNG